MNVVRIENAIRQKRTIDNCIIKSAVFLLIVLVYFYFSFEKKNTNNSDAENLAMFVLCSLMYVIGIIQWIKMKNRLISIYMFFYVYMFLSNTGQEVVFFVQKNNFAYASVFSRFSNGDVTQWLLYQTVCVAAINLSAALATKYVNSKYRYKTGGKRIRLDKYGRNLIKLIYILSAMVMILFSLMQLVQRQGSSYADFRENTTTSANAYASFAFIATSYYFLLKTDESWSRKKKYIITMVAIVAMVFMAGTRSVAIPIVACLLFCTRELKPEWFSKKYIPLYLVAIFGFMYILSVISAVRTSGLGTLSLSSLFVYGFVDGVLQMIYEMGISMLCGLYTIKAIRDGIPHYQTFAFYTARSFIPGAILKLFGVVEPACGRLSDWVSNYAGFTYSIGYSGMAESYMNYGMQGWLFFLVYGFIIVLAENISVKKIENNRFLYSSVVLTLLSKQVFFARAQFDLCTTYLRFAFYIFIVYRLIALSKRSRS